jgi:DNA-binding transcriptional MocR family regulator
MVPSEIRALFAVASRPEIVSLAGGMPCLDALPLDSVAHQLSELVAERGSVALQYGSAQGDPGLREQVCAVMRLEGIAGHPDDVVITAGAQQGLDLIIRLFVDPGDVVFAEAPTYVGALTTFASYEANVVHVAMDEEGLIPEALRDAIVRVRARGWKAKLLYTVPNFQNPAGRTLSQRRREEILDICRRAGVLVIEDNPYGLLRFAGEPIPALRAAADEGVIYLGSFSKTFAPGFRVGWVLAPRWARRKLVLAAESALLCHSSVAQLAVSRYLSTEPWRDRIGALCELYGERRNAMLSALDAHLPAGCQWTRPDGGFFVWLRLPEGLDSKAMAPRAIDAGVAYVPGTGFFSDGSGREHLRLSFCYPPPNRIREGVRRLAGVVRQELEQLPSAA